MRSLSLMCLVFLTVSACDCGKKPAAPSLLKEGEPCENDERCETGLCDAAPGYSPVCVRRCGDGCFTTEVCVQLTPNRFACQPDQRKLCAPCVSDSDCPYPSDHCITVNNENVCGRDCAFDQNCPTGYRCVNSIGVDGQPKVQQCVPINASCSCLARGDFQQPCTTTNSFGSCTGIKDCDLVTNTVVCNAATPAAETCNGKDDNCNGMTDEGQMGTTCGVGACQRTVSSCVDGGVATCQAGMPVNESCNSIDDDCDGMTDEDFDLQTNAAHCGSCNHACALPHASASNCADGGCVVGTCETNYQNCNMMDPDGCEVNTTNDAMNCGGCGNACSRQHSTPSCVNSMCNFVCAPGFVDLNMDPSDGCEYACTFVSATDLPDLMFVDANCDGIDGEVGNAIFVSTAGNDSNDGSRMTPVATINQAVTLASTTGKRDVYVSAGAYTGPMTLTGVNGINVAGAYNATTWQRNLTMNQVTVQNGNPALLIDGANNVLVQAFKFVGANGDSTNPSAYAGRINESGTVRLESLDMRAGNGLAGTAGSSTAGTATGGSPGSVTTIGSSASCYNDPRNDSDHLIGCNFFYDTCSGAPAGGTGGAGCGGANGGAGGAPSLYNTPTIPVGQPGQAGANVGGTAGQGVPPLVTPAIGSQYYGGNGANGANGTNGIGAAAGVFTASGFNLSSAGGGTSGNAGKGGGGGGGGAGGLGPPFFGTSAIITCYSYGSPGAGGGGAGCGGTSGGPGTSGGASVGLFLNNSQVTASAVVLRSGNGGNGGAGGAGQTGGTGGAGGTPKWDTEQGNATPAGGGGKGGNGGTGGHGGGGAGGPAYGLVKNAASTWTPTGGSVQFGTAGTGGPSSGNPGVNGAAAVQFSF